MNGPLTTTPDYLTLCDHPGGYRAAFQAAALPMALLDSTGRILSANPAFGELLGTDGASLAGAHADTSDALQLDGAIRDGLLTRLQQTGLAQRHTHRLKHADGSSHFAEIALQPLPYRAVTDHGAALLTVTDIGERIALQEKLRHLRMHDPVTRLPNRALFFERLTSALSDSATGRIGLCYLDVDGFKAINDTLGHRVGDQLLDAVARRLAHCAAGGYADSVSGDGTELLPHARPSAHTSTDSRADSADPRADTNTDSRADSRTDPAAWSAAGRASRRHEEAVDHRREPPDVSAAGGGHLVARLGGDEFAVLVEDSLGTEQLTALADAVLAALHRPFDLDGHRLAVSASIGVVERGCAHTTPTGLMQAANATLYWAKDDGKDRWVLFDPERNAHRMTRQSLSARLRPAVERGEFQVQYQPIVGLVDDRLRGVEALVRWNHPELGQLSPDRFISLAEETGAIVPLGRWVLSEACRQARRWQLEHPDRPLFASVNVAVRQVWDSDLVHDVLRVLEETGLPAGLLQLELTESAVMGSAGRPLQALQDLSERGVRIAIDDFGTGYSNLAYLSRLPVRTLKLDGTFVRSFRTARHLNPADETIVSSLVELAHKLGLTVTAECVEDPAQAERLRRIGCDTGQGWHYARAMSSDAIRDLLATNQPLGPGDLRTRF